MGINEKLEISRQMGMVFQGSALFDSMNVIENINNTVVPEMDWATEKNISYTQLSAWMECPHR